MEFGFGSSPSYYSVLGISPDSSFDEIRRAYRKLAMQWHPDRWTKNPSLLGKAKRKFQEIQQAYSVLSDQRKRTMYDAGLLDPHQEQDEGFYGFMEELMSYMDNENRSKREYSLGELQEMLNEMMEDFQSQPLPPLKASSWHCKGAQVVDDSRSSKRARFDLNRPPDEMAFDIKPREVYEMQPAILRERNWHSGKFLL